MQGLYDRAQALGIPSEIKTVVRGQLTVPVRHQCRLGWSMRVNQSEKAGIAIASRCKWIAFKVVFDTSRHQRRQFRDIIRANVALVRPWMHGNAMGTGIDRRGGRRDDTRLATATGVAQHRNLVHIDA